MMQATKDGHTWGTEKWRDLPKLGQHGKPVEWHALGHFPQRFQCRFRVTDDVNRDIYGVGYEIAR